MALFFTADTHFGDHRTINIHRWPFASVAEMTKRSSRPECRSRRGGRDLALGDMARRSADAAPLVAQLNGIKHLVRGNNDEAATGQGPSTPPGQPVEDTSEADIGDDAGDFAEGQVPRNSSIRHDSSGHPAGGLSIIRPTALRGRGRDPEAHRSARVSRVGAILGENLTPPAAWRCEATRRKSRAASVVYCCGLDELPFGVSGIEPLLAVPPFYIAPFDIAFLLDDFFMLLWCMEELPDGELLMLELPIEPMEPD